MKTAEIILNALSEPILVLNSSFQAIMANPAFYGTFLTSPGELADKPVQELICTKEGPAAFLTILQEVLSDASTTRAVELRCNFSSGADKLLLLSARFFNADLNMPDLVLVELRDITDEREKERRIQLLNEDLQKHSAELEVINDELESFTHSASHDLRTPLRLTNKIAHMLLQDHAPQLDEAAIKKIHMILDSTHEMGKLIEDLLAFSEIKHMPVRKRRVDVNRLAQEALAELHDDQLGRNVNVAFDQLPPCQADRALLKQVYLNLIANALKFTRPREQAEIDIGFKQSNGDAVYFVRDNGVGFDMAHADSIFLPFHRLHRAQDFEGSGIGLALVKRIIEYHMGRIWVESQIGQGTAIYFTLDEKSADTAANAERITT